MGTKSTPQSETIRFKGVGTRRNGTTFTLSGIGTGLHQLNWTDSVTYGENIAGWRDKLRNGQSATTSLVGSSSTAQVTQGHLKLKKNGNPPFSTSTVYGEFTGFDVNPSIPSSDPTSINSSSADAEALGRFVRRAYDVQHAIQGGVVLGELRETLQTIRNPARGLRRLVSQWRNNAIKLRRAKNFLPINERKRKIVENLADAWLEAQYGWRPLMSDIKAGSDALSRYVKGQPLDTRRITGRGESNAISEPESTVTKIYNGFRWQYTTRTTSNCIVIYRGAVRVKARDPRVMDPALLGFDLASWAPTLWELVPYSFLIDYFSNVGDMILGFSTLGIDFAWKNRTTVRFYERVYDTRPDPSWFIESQDWNDGGYTVQTYVPGKVVLTKRSVSRGVYSGLTVPDLTFEIPSFRSLKWLNLAALVAARRSDRSYRFD